MINSNLFSRFNTLLLYFLVILSLSCTQGGAADDSDIDVDLSKTSNLSVVVSSNSSDIQYPIYFCAFGADGACIAQQVVSRADEVVSLTLKLGRYTLVAVSGADGFRIPEIKTINDKIRLLESADKPTSALMMGSVNVNLQSNTTATISMSYRVARLSLTFSNVPENITSVGVEISPLYNSIGLNGDYDGAGSRYEVSLKKEAGLWVLPELFLFSGSGHSTVLTISLTDAVETLTYGYTLTQPLQSATPYSIAGSYKGSLVVDGVFDVEGWKEQVDVNFDFGEGVDDGGGDGGDGGDEGGAFFDQNHLFVVDAIPSALSIWNGHVVCAVESKGENEAELTILSLKEWDSIFAANATNASQANKSFELCATYTEGNLNDWQIPVKSQALLLREICKTSESLDVVNGLLQSVGGNVLAAEDKDDLDNKIRYLCDGSLFSFSLLYSSNMISSTGTSRVYNLRLVRKVRVSTVR